MSFVTILASVALGIAAYVGVSIFFLKNPQYLHKKKKIPFNACHISHRGGAGECLENTISAFKHAVECGTEMLELDCHITKDNQIVVSHDQSLLRTAGVNAGIADFRYDELPSLNEILDPHRGCFFAKTEDRKIPLLKDVFDAFPNLPINIDIKMNDDRLIAEVSSLVKAYNREHITVWGNYRPDICQKCYEHNPNIHLLFSFKRFGLLIVSFYLGFLPFITFKENFYETAMLGAYLTNPHLKLSARYRIIMRIFDFLIMRKWMFEHLQKRGMRVFLFVLNTEEDFKRGFSYGVDGVMTDYPTKLQEFLVKNPLLKCRKRTEIEENLLK